MARKSKRLTAREKMAPAGKKEFTKAEALGLIKEMCAAHPCKFDETIQVSVRLGIDARKPEQALRGTYALPHGTGKTPRIVVFAQGDQAREAEEAGADRVGADDLAKEIREGWLDFDVAIAAPDMMRTVGQLGKILGPRGLMPNPKSGTVTPNIKNAVEEFKAGKVEYRNDSFGNVHVPIGRASFEAKKLEENFDGIYETILKVKPAAAKGQYVRSVYVSSTMGPGLKVSVA